MRGQSFAWLTQSRLVHCFLRLQRQPQRVLVMATGRPGYIGGSVGGGWGNVDTNVNCLGDDFAARSPKVPSTHFSFHLDGGPGRGQVGFNFQAGGNLVLGY